MSGEDCSASVEYSREHVASPTGLQVDLATFAAAQATGGVLKTDLDAYGAAFRVSRRSDEFDNPQDFRVSGKQPDLDLLALT